MSLWSRIVNALHGDRLSREIDEEVESHVAEAVRLGRHPLEAREALGSALRQREHSRDIRVLPWLDSLRADAVFGWRQLNKRKTASAAAILSLALAIGACTSAFRLIDALLLRPLPVANPERLYSVSFRGPGMDGISMTYDSCSYPMFLQMRSAVKDQAESIAVSYTERIDLTYGTDLDMERAYRQYVSGRMFGAFGLRAAAGRLLTANDDATPGAHPVAVLSYDYWSRRFGADPKAVGRTFRMGEGIYEIVGVAEPAFTGTETGTVTDIFVPMMMKEPPVLFSASNFWLRTLVQLKPASPVQPVIERLRATFRALQEAQPGSRSSTTKPGQIPFNDQLLLEPASAGRSNLQRDFHRPLVALGILVALVLLIACANVANLLMAQAAARSRELALRISIGAGRWRLVQLVLVESAWLAFLATAIGALFAWWAAPFILGTINPPDNPARLALPADWRVLGFSLTLALGVTFLFGLAPALRASSIQPVSALKGGEDPHSRRRMMHGLIALQVAFCFVVHFVAGLFVTSFDRLSHQPTGFSAERILNLETAVPRPQPPAYWDQVLQHLRAAPGVETAAITTWPLMSGESRVASVAVGGAPPSEVLCDVLSISPDWLQTMRIPLIDGRDFRSTDAAPVVAIVNRTFARQYFNGEDPVGKSFEIAGGPGGNVGVQIIGFVPDARSRDDMRRPIRATAYLPFQAADATGALKPNRRGTFVVRTSSQNPLALASILRQEVPRARQEFRVTTIRAQSEINIAHALRERLLAWLALFFAAVALLLAGVGLYGVLDYSVLQRRREIGIRLAIGAQGSDIARRVTGDIFVMVLVGALAGLGLGMISMRYIEALLFQVKATDLAILVLPPAAILTAAFLAALPAVIRAVRIDPVTMLRSD